jgi:hypothetical protein
MVLVRQLILVGALAGSFASGADAQASAGDRMKNVAVNGVIGATRAAWDAYRARRPVPRAAALGFFGGATVAGGKQLTGFGRGPTLLAGRLLATAGNSISLSAGRGQPTFVVFIGPVSLTGVQAQHDGDSTAVTRWRWRARLNALHLGYLAYYATNRDYRFEFDASARAGVPVFRKRAGLIVDGDVSLLGMQQLGVVLVADRSQFLPIEISTPAGPMLQVPPSEREIIAHEGIHVLQEDQYNFLVALPTERALVQRVPGLRRLGRHIDFGILGSLAVLGSEHLIRYERRPWEQEAARLAVIR